MITVEDVDFESMDLEIDKIEMTYAHLPYPEKTVWINRALLGYYIMECDISHKQTQEYLNKFEFESLAWVVAVIYNTWRFDKSYSLKKTLLHNLDTLTRDELINKYIQGDDNMPLVSYYETKKKEQEKEQADQITKGGEYIVKITDVAFFTDQKHNTWHKIRFTTSNGKYFDHKFVLRGAYGDKKSTMFNIEKIVSGACTEEEKQYLLHDPDYPASPESQQAILAFEKKYLVGKTCLLTLDEKPHYQNVGEVEVKLSKVTPTNQHLNVSGVKIDNDVPFGNEPLAF